MDINAKLVTKTSKTGNKYSVIEIPITSNESIVLFLTKEQEMLLKIIYKPKGQ